MGCLLQTLTGTTVIDCAAGLTGPIAALPAGSTYCAGDSRAAAFSGEFVQDGSGHAGAEGVCANAGDLHEWTEQRGGADVSGWRRVAGAGYELFDDDECGGAYAGYQLAYASAFGQFLASPSVTGGAAGGSGTGGTEVSVMGGLRIKRPAGHRIIARRAGWSSSYRRR